MPAPAKLVTLTQAKAHLQITLPDGDPGDTEIQDTLNAAEAIILTYLKDAKGAADWTDPTSTPGPVVQAIKLMLGQLYEHRGDDDTDYAEFWHRIDLLLAQHFVTAIA